MPRFITERETVDLHAPWWSDAKDDTGRYKERCVIYAEMTEKDEQTIALQTSPKVNARGGRNTEISMKEQSYARMYMLLHMIREFTDESGKPQPVNREMILTLSRRDSAWIADEIDRLNRPLIEPTEEDEAEAEERGVSPTEVAAERFRGARPRLVSKR